MSRTGELIRKFRTDRRIDLKRLSSILPNASADSLEKVERGLGSHSLDRVFEIGRALRLTKEEMKQLCLTALEEEAPIYCQYVEDLLLEKENSPVSRNAQLV